ncbi:exonuclease VII [Stenotrophomonas phage BUCT598]|uniref:Exonuclease VII n=2 Tax=Smasvirus TaxID=3424922 RepID=A0A8F2F3K6_9CAUD|nr:exonuclease VII [Stenotrophomonas phage BUCT598]UFI08414.1 endonuclease [Stenotrophomonas phage vB_SmaS_P15]
MLHRGCNSGLGVVENGAKRFGFLSRLIQFCMGLGAYLRKHEENRTGLLHPTHRTADEKRLLRNKRARIARAKKKEAAA